MDTTQKKLLSKTKLYRNRAWLKETYIKRELSIPEIANMHKYGTHTIHIWLKKLKIPTRSISEATKLSYRKKKLREPYKIIKLMGSKSANWNGGKFRHSAGGFLFYTPDHPNVLSRKRYYPYILEHRLVAEKALGRYLKSEEIVHHVNGDKGDNRNCNLLICNNSYHAYLHQRMATFYMKEHFGGGIRDKSTNSTSMSLSSK